MNLVRANNRQHSRQTPPHAIAATVTIAGQTYPAGLVDYSLLGVGVRLDRGAFQRAEREKNQIHLSLNDSKYVGRVRHSRVIDRDVVFGVDLQELKEEDNAFFSSEDPDWDLIEDKETLANIFSDLAFKGPEALIDMRQLKGQGTIIATQLKNEKTLVCELFEMKRGEFEAGLANVRFEMFQTCHALEASVQKIEKTPRGVFLELELPTKVARLLRRETYRVLNRENGKFLTVRLRSRLLGVAPEEIEIYDFSEHGFSILDPTEWAYAPAGVMFDEITFTTNDGKVVHGRGTIRGYRWLANKSTYAIGVMFETDSDQDRNVWHNLILESRYPQLSLDYRPQDHSEIWELFRRSDYLHLKGEDAYADTIKETEVTWSLLAKAGSKYSKRAVIRKEHEVVGHIQMDRMYPNTWCVHHLALDPQISKLVAKEIYAIIPDVLHAEEGTCVMSFTEAAKPWNQRSYYDFVKQYPFPEHNELKKFEVYEAKPGKTSSMLQPDSFQVRKATNWDLKRIARYFEVYGSKLEREAFALSEDELELRQFASKCNQYDLIRSRQFVVAYDGPTLIGVARLERATNAVNIVGIFDILYVHLIPSLGTDAGKVTDALIFWALSEFREMGVEKVFVALDDGRIENHTLNGLTFVTNAVRWLASREVFRRYSAFSQMLYGHLLFRKEKIRKKRITG